MKRCPRSFTIKTMTGYYHTPTTLESKKTWMMPRANRGRKLPEPVHGAGGTANGTALWKTAWW